MNSVQAEERFQDIIAELDPKIVQAIVVMARVGYVKREAK